MFLTATCIDARNSCLHMFGSVPTQRKLIWLCSIAWELYENNKMLQSHESLQCDMIFLVGCLCNDGCGHGFGGEWRKPWGKADTEELFASCCVRLCQAKHVAGMHSAIQSAMNIFHSRYLENIWRCWSASPHPFSDERLLLVADCGT